MGTLVGHVAPGLGFLIIGLWHLFNNIKLHIINQKSYKSLPWFPTSKIRYFELYSIMIGSCSSIAMELFIGPSKHQPFDHDFTIPSNHLHNFEHSSISLSFLVYAIFAIILDLIKIDRKHKHGMTQLIASIAFGQQLLLFRLHSADHLGIEGQYHLLLQILIFVTLATTLMGIGFDKNFLISFVRSLSIMFQGLWFMVMGFMIWTPSLLPKGCFLYLHDGHQIVKCSTEDALHRAKSLVNIEFSYYLIAMIIFGMSMYLVMVTKYSEKVEYRSLIKGDLGDEEREEDIDLESQMKIELDHERQSFIRIGKGFEPIDMER